MTKVNNIYIIVILLFGVIRNCNAYSVGAPPFTCTTLLPRHGGLSAQASSAPYEITVSPTSYTGGSVVTVTLRGLSGTQFRGYNMQMRRTDNSSPAGGFSIISGGQLLACSDQNNAGVTHTERSDKTSVSFRWTAPSVPVGPIQMVSTVLQSYPVFWTNVRSVELNVMQENSTVTTEGQQSPTIMSDNITTPTIGIEATTTSVRSPESTPRNNAALIKLDIVALVFFILIFITR